MINGKLYIKLGMRKKGEKSLFSHHEQIDLDF